MTTTKAKPILFKGEMVRALLAGTKTQTRRIIKPQPVQPRSDAYFDAYAGGPVWCWWSPDNKMFNDAITKCPYVVGDHLWVRETWHMSGLGYGNDLGIGRVHYRATDKGDWKSYWGHWKPSIFMPRAYSRLTLEVTEIRVERLTSISSADCVAEGLPPTMRNDAPVKERYRDLWESINGRGSWALNPVVWIYTFKRVTEGA